jgi:transcriptional regulator with XRE-family HTH domain
VSTLDNLDNGLAEVEIKMSFGMTVKAARKRRRMTQPQVAERLGVTAQAVSEWERDKSLPELTRLAHLADLLGLTLEELHREAQRSGVPPGLDAFQQLLEMALVEAGYTQPSVQEFLSDIRRVARISLAQTESDQALAQRQRLGQAQTLALRLSRL